jgi:hypothetical protein
MQRRQAVTSIAAGFGAIFTLPTWATNWRQESLKITHFLPTESAKTLAEIVETIIPETNTPGAKSLGIDKLIERIVKDCYDKPAQEQFTRGIALVDELAQKTNNQPFTACSTAQRLAILLQMSKSDDAGQKKFYNMVRQMTIRGYTTSEYFMTKIEHFEFAPARFHGCVKVK